MKVRIYRNSLRFRLDDDDLDRLLETGSIVEELRFGGAAEESLVYSVETRESAIEPEAVYAEGRIRVFIRREAAADLASESAVCIDTSQHVEGSAPLSIQVEKEFLP